MIYLIAMLWPFGAAGALRVCQSTSKHVDVTDGEYLALLALSFLWPAVVALLVVALIANIDLARLAVAWHRSRRGQS